MNTTRARVTTSERHGRAVAFRVAVLAAATLVAACGDTEGALVSVNVAIGADGEATHRTSTGWDVTLDEASIVLGPVYAYAPEPLTRRLGRALVPVALAHGGVDPLNGRRVRLEVLDARAIDLLAADPLVLQGVPAEAGMVDVVTVVLRPPADAAGPTRGHQAWVSGVATRHGRTVTFAGGLDLPGGDLADRVENVVADVDVREGGTFRLSVDLDAWLDDAEFDVLEPGPDGVAEIGPDDPVRNAWFLAVRSARSYRATFEDAHGGGSE